MTHLFHTRNLHLGVYLPWREPAARQHKLGIGGRVRHRGRWRQAMVYAGWPRRDLRVGRLMFLVEAKTWLATRPSGKGSGVPGSKMFIRLKVGSGHSVPSSRKKRAIRAAERAPVMSYRTHLWLNLRLAVRWLAWRETAEDREFEEATNG